MYHKCGSTKAKRPTQASFECLACGCQYNADLNGAINIALRYLLKNACSSCRSLKTAYLKGGFIVCSEWGQKHSIKEKEKATSEVVRMIFLSSRSNNHKKSEGVSKSMRPLLKPQGTGEPPPCNESTGKEGLGKDALIPIKLKVEEAGRRKHFLKI